MQNSAFLGHPVYMQNKVFLPSANNFLDRENMLSQFWEI